MRKEDIKIGDKVKAIFVKYGKHLISGEVFEISTDEHGLRGDWISIRVTGGDLTDKQVAFMVQEHINVMVPVNNVIQVL